MDLDEYIGPKASKERNEWAKYRWEFMRRDPQYKQDYDEIRSQLNKVTIPNDWKEFLDETGFVKYPDGYKTEEQKHRLFCEQYGLAHFVLLDPDMSYEELSDKYGEFNIVNPILPSSLSIDLPRDDNCELIIKIDLKKVNSIRSLKEMVSETVGIVLDRFGEQEEKTYLVRQDFKKILKVEDLLKRNNMTNQDIAKQIFPDEFDIENEEANPESAIRSAGNYRNRYKELINGGYLNLIYP